MSTTDTTLAIDADAIDAALARGLTFPSSWYADPAILRVELEEILRRAWQVVAFESRVANVGDHVVGHVGDVPVVVVRGEDGALRGFINVCRHRAFPVARCDGNRRTLQCQYHAWTYGLDGRLRQAPRSEHEPGFDRAEFGLLPIVVETLGGFVWACTDPDGPSLDQAHPSLRALVEEWEIDASGHTVPRPRQRFDLPANWKVFIENTSECYHCPTVHKAFGDAFDVTYEGYVYVDRDRISGQFSGSNERRNPLADASGRYRFVYVWPSTFLEIDDIRASWMTVRPNGPEGCHVEWDALGSPDVAPDVAEAWDAMYTTTMEEDFVVVAAQQPNLSSAAVPHGRLMASSESAIASFHRLYWSELRAALARRGEVSAAR